VSSPPPVWSELWQDIVTHHPTIQWPVADEVELELIGKDWHELGTAFVTAGESQPAGDQAIAEAWQGRAGQGYRQQLTEARRSASADGEEMQTVGQLATVLAEEVMPAKEQITDLIRQHEEFYLDLTWWLKAWFGGSEAARGAEEYRADVPTRSTPSSPRGCARSRTASAVSAITRSGGGIPVMRVRRKNMAAWHPISVRWSCGRRSAVGYASLGTTPA